MMPELPATSFSDGSDPNDDPDRTALAGHVVVGDQPPDDNRPDTLIAGRYRLIEPLGEGGMGAVWKARQIEPVTRDVAIKLIRSGLDSKAVVARFEAERQALSMMDHPNIARVFDAGTTPAGRPYFAMELVKGTPITEFCDQRKYSPRQRLELFVPVCHAIQHAHQKGIIHRDIKPSNVLVEIHDDKPAPKVIDFGVAKAIGFTLTDATLDAGFEQIVGTPLYMSPEQATLDQPDVDTRSDVYSLGVMLYELLTGTTPIERARFREAAILELLRVVREEDPPRPSTRLRSTDARTSIAAVRNIEPASLSKLLRSELDWIVMKSLEKDRTRRYDSASGFAADVLRYLAGEPVQAHPPGALYRLKKFAARNRAAVAASAAVLLALVAGITGTTIGLLQAREQERIASRAAVEEREAKEREAGQKLVAQQKEREAIAAAEEERKAKVREAEQRSLAEKARDHTRDVLDIMTSAVTGDSLATQKEITAEQRVFLGEVLKYYREFAGETPDNEQSRKRTASAAYKVGMIEYRLGRAAASETAFKTARDLLAALATEFPKQEYRADLAGSHVCLGVVLDALTRKPEAEAAYGAALAIQEKLAAESPDVHRFRADVARTHNNLGVLLESSNKRTEAEAAYRQALAVREQLAAEFPAIPLYRSELGGSHNNLAILLQQTVLRRPEAMEEHRKALEVRSKLVAEHPTGPYRSQLAASHLNLGALLQNLGRPGAEAAYRTALSINARLTVEFPAIPQYRSDLGACHNNLGAYLNALAKRDEAETELRKALSIRERLAADFSNSAPYRSNVAATHGNLGQLLQAAERWAEADEQFGRSVAVAEKLVADFPAVVAFRTDLANRRYFNHACLCAVASGRVAEKKQEYADRAVDILHKAVKAGFTDADRLAKQPDLESLRSRDDFKKLLDTLKAKPAGN